MTIRSHNQSDFFQFNNIVSIVTSIVLITLAFGALMTRVAVIESKIDSILAFEKQTQDEIVSIQNQQNQLSNRLTILETKFNVNK